MKIVAGRDVGQTIGFCGLSSAPRLTLAKDDRPKKAMVCPTFAWAQGDFRECGRLSIGLLTVRRMPRLFVNRQACHFR
jgi:hypothetical protein